jgi:hypothetical protein
MAKNVDPPSYHHTFRRQAARTLLPLALYVVVALALKLFEATDREPVTASPKGFCAEFGSQLNLRRIRLSFVCTSGSVEDGSVLFQLWQCKRRERIRFVPPYSSSLAKSETDPYFVRLHKRHRRGRIRLVQTLAVEASRTDPSYSVLSALFSRI